MGDADKAIEGDDGLRCVDFKVVEPRLLGLRVFSRGPLFLLWKKHFDEDAMQKGSLAPSVGQDVPLIWFFCCEVQVDFSWRLARWLLKWLAEAETSELKERN